MPHVAVSRKKLVLLTHNEPIHKVRENSHDLGLNDLRLCQQVDDPSSSQGSCDDQAAISDLTTTLITKDHIIRFNYPLA